MKTFKIFTILFLLSVFSTGCGTLEQFNTTKAAKATVETAVSATNLRYYYENGEVVEFVGNANLSEEEQETVLMSLNKIDTIKNKLKMYENRPQDILKDIDSLKGDYLALKAEYEKVRAIVVDHFEEYTPKERKAFVEFDKAAHDLDDKVENVHDFAATNETIQTILRFGDIGLKVVSML